MSAMRIGQGFDAHRFSVPAASADSDGSSSPAPRELWLACMRWTDDERRGVQGFAGDSDGDVAAHALIDAMLSACGMGDIGGFFGVGAASAGAGRHGADMVCEVARRCAEDGWTFVNGCVSIVCNDPHVSRHRGDAEEAMGRAAGFPVSITATTTDGMGFTGRGEGASALATVLAVRTGRGAADLSAGNAR